MQHSKATVDEVLETIADTILQCVMFQAEAEETGARLKSLNTQGLVEAMNFLASLAQKKAQLWGEFDKNMQQEMIAATKELQDATLTIVQDIATISTNPISKPAKKSLLTSAKTMMQRTVFLLQVADLYDIRQIIKFAQETKSCNDQMAACRSVDELPDLVRNYIFQSVSLAKIAKIRAEYIVDPILKKKISKPNDEIIAVLPEKIIELQMYAVQDAASPEQLQLRDQLHDQVTVAADEIITLAKETSATLFAGLDLDIPFGDDDDERLPDPLGDLKPDYGAAKQKAMAAMAALSKAVAAGDRAGAAVAAQMVKEAVDEMLANAENDPSLKDEAERLAQAMRDLFNSMKPAVEDPRNAAKMKNFNDAMRAIQEACDRLANAAEAGSRAAAEADPFSDAAAAAASAMADLKAAVAAGNATAAAAAAAALAQAVEQMKDGMDPDDRARLQKAIQDLGDKMKDLFNTAQAAAKDPTNKAKMAAFERAMADCGNLMNALIAGVRPAEGELDEADRMKMAAAKVANAVAGLNSKTVGSAAQAIDPPAIADAVKAVNRAVGLQAVMAKMLSPNKGDRALSENLSAAAKRLADAMAALIDATKAYAANPNDPATAQRMRDAMRNLEAVSQEVGALTQTAEAQMLDAGGDLLNALSKLNDAIQTGNPNRIDEAKKDVAAAVRRQLILVKPIANGKTRSGEKETLLEAARKMADAMKALAAAADLLAKNPKDPNAIAAFNRALLDLQRAGLVLAEGALNPAQGGAEAALIANSARMDELASVLDRAVREGRKEDARAAAYVLEKAAGRQAVLAKLGAAKIADRQRQQRLLAASDALAKAMKALADHTYNTTEAPRDAAARARLDQTLESLRRANAEMVDSVISVHAAEDLVYAAANAIAGMIDRLAGRVGPNSHDDLVKIAEALSQQIALAQNVERRTEDPKKKQAINAASSRAEAALRELREGIGALERNPQDRAVHKRLEDALGEAKAASKALGVAVNMLPEKNPERKLIATGESLNANIGTMVTAVKGKDTATAERLLPVVERQMVSQARTAEALSKKVENPEIKNALGKASADQQKLIPQFVTAARAAIENPNSAQAVANFEKVAGDARRANEAIISLAKRVEKGEGSKKATSSAAQSALDKATSIEGAGRAMRDATRMMKVDDTPRGKIVGASKRIGELMETLSRAGQAGDKKGMIAAAREISALSVDIVKNADALASVCKDESTRDHLMSMAYAAKNFGIQLKILGAVKSATEGTDKTTETQLLTCSKGLAGSILQTIAYADVADLKKK